MKNFTREEKAEYARLGELIKQGTATEAEDHAHEAYKTAMANYITIPVAVVVFGAMGVISAMRGGTAISFMAVLFIIFAIYNSLHTAKMYRDYWDKYFKKLSKKK